ncbi:hypothetical protein FB45DRAFT_869342 [Roridomyces roridus]|uniref:Uncharacterized protein n=1 Tax=Roridomyces roridus TaxID=1738132 RepID=A0AAD7BLM9_9AGAR|nr:hypothetical protein FB45DRAFT_869342 [Roridomyces roridus]
MLGLFGCSATILSSPSAHSTACLTVGTVPEYMKLQESILLALIVEVGAEASRAVTLVLDAFSLKNSASPPKPNGLSARPISEFVAKSARLTNPLGRLFLLGVNSAHCEPLWIADLRCYSASQREKIQKNKN